MINDTNCSKTMVSGSIFRICLNCIYCTIYTVGLNIHCYSQELDEFVETLAKLGRPDFDRDLLRRLMAEFDVDDSGTIDANEFSMIMVNHFCNTDPPRGEVVVASSGSPWQIPESGIAEFHVKYESELPKASDIGADAGIDSVVFAMQDAKNTAQKQILFEQAINSPYFYLSADQAQLLYDEVLAYSKHKMDAMALILPQIVNSEECLQFLDHNLDGNCIYYFSVWSIFLVKRLTCPIVLLTLQRIRKAGVTSATGYALQRICRYSHGTLSA